MAHQREPYIFFYIYNNIIKGFPPEAPTHWKPLRIGRPYRLKNTLFKFITPPAKLKGDRENSYVARQNISSAKATV